MALNNSITYMNDLDTSCESSVGIEDLFGKSILITGATGSIGSYLVDMFIRANEKLRAEIEIYASGRSDSTLEKRFGYTKDSHLHYVHYDLMQQIEFNHQIDYIIHTAGNAHAGTFNIDPVGTIIGNISGTYNLLEYARSHGTKRLLYLSSGEVYGQGDLSLDSFSETYGGYVDPVSPRSCYPNSKRTTETLCASYYKQYGLETVIVRPCHTYGPTIKDNDIRAQAMFVQNGVNGQDIVMNSAGEQMRSYCYVADCASAIVTVLTQGNAGEAYNSANPDSRATIAEFAKEVARQTDRHVIFKNPTETDLKNRTPIAKQVLDSAKLEKLGWKGKFSLSLGIQHSIKIIKDSKGL